MAPHLMKGDSMQTLIERYKLLFRGKQVPLILAVLFLLEIVSLGIKGAVCVMALCILMVPPVTILLDRMMERRNDTHEE